MAAIFAPLFYPPTWAAIGKAAAWTAGALGLVGTAYVASEAINEMSQDDADTGAGTGTATETDTTTCADCAARRECPPCNPPAGTRMFKRLDRVPPSAPHWPCSGDHVHILIRRQDPGSCRCFWNRPSPPDDVICIPQGGSAPSDLFVP